MTAPVTINITGEGQSETPVEVPGDAPSDTAAGVPVTVYVVVEGMRTSDGRYIVPGSLTHRALPIPILGMAVNSESGHTGAEVFGRLDTLVRIPGPELINRQTGGPFDDGTFVWVGTGTVDPDHELTAKVRAGYLTGNSVDLSEVEFEIIWGDDDDDDGMLFAEPEEIRFTAGVIAGVTACPFPAFAEAYIEIDGNPIVPADDLPAELRASGSTSVLVHDDPADTLTASGSVSELPPVGWFADPALSGPTPLTVTDEGRVFGHLALWGVAHIGFDGARVTAPHSATGYAYFHLHATRARELDADDREVVVEVPVGHLTLGGGHAGTGLGAPAATAHYDDAGTRAARIAVGEDAHGIWFAGVTASGLTAVQRRDLAESATSGDWRRIGGHLELVATLAVNVPGFPIPRSRVASGRSMALVAAGGVAHTVARSSGAVVLDYDTLADAIALRLEQRDGARRDLAGRRDAALALMSRTDRRAAALGALRP